MTKGRRGNVPAFLNVRGNFARHPASNPRQASFFAWKMRGESPMKLTIAILAATAVFAAGAAAAAATPTDPQIAHIAYTAGTIDIAAGKQALARARNTKVRDFAKEMVRDHQAVNAKALALVKKLHVKPEDNPTSQGLSKAAAAERAKLARLKGAAFDREYIKNEVAYHKTVNGALENVLSPSARNGELKSLLETGLTLFREHQAHAEEIAKGVK